MNLKTIYQTCRAISCRVGYGSTTLAGLTAVDTTTFVSHSAFNRTTLDNDIAIVFLPFASRIVFSDAVRAIALPTAAPTTGLEGSLGGFGYTQANAEAFSDTLVVASLVTVDNAVCTARFSSIPFTTHFCANGRDSVIPGLISNICSGDNGAGFYTGDGMITTTTTTTTTTLPPDEEGIDPPDEETEAEEGTQPDEGTENGTENETEAENQVLQIKTTNDESVSEQVEPTLVK